MNEHEKMMLKEYQEMLKAELFGDLSKDAKSCAHDYSRHKMLASVIGTIHEIDELMEEKGEYKEFSDEDAYQWASHMENADGTTGAHWPMEATTAVAVQNGVMFDHISAADWMVAMNMIYSDYGKTLEAAGITDPNVYASLAKDFLFDEDSVPPKEKLCYYYKYIVKK